MGGVAAAVAPSGSRPVAASESVAAPSGAAAPSAGSYVALAPKRLLDTRVSGKPVAARGIVSLPVLGHGGIPASGVSSVVVNLTVTAATSTGYLVMYPYEGTRPVASSTNFQPGRTVAHTVVVKVAGNGGVDIYNGSAGTVEAIVDIEG